MIMGWLTPGPNVGPGLHLETRSRPSGNDSEVRIEIGLPKGFAEAWQSTWDEVIIRLRELRPLASDWIYPLSQSSILDIFESRPATRLAHGWLKYDLDRLGWLESSL